MKIFVFGTRGFPGIQGGVEKHCEFLYGNISDIHEITVFRRRSYVVCRNFKNINFIDLPSTKIKGVEAFIHSFLCTLYSIVMRPDIVHIHNIGPALFSPLIKMFGLKIIVTYHSPNYNHKKWNILARNILKFAEYVTFKFADQIIYVNRSQMALAPLYVKNKSLYLPNGISQFPKFNTMEECLVLNKYDIKSNHYLLAVGRLTHEKGFDLLIKAFCEIDNSQQYKLVIVGDNPSDLKYSDSLKNLRKNPNIIFTGSLQGKSLAILYSNCLLYVLSSRYEGFPLVLLEAMSFNKNVLVSDILKDTDLVLSEDDFFVSDSVQALKKGLDNKLTNNLNGEDIKYNLDMYDWREIALKTEEVFFRTKK